MDTTSGRGSGFGQTLRRLREGRLSQAELALRAATSQSYLSRVERGDVEPTLAQANHLLNCLGYSLSVGVELLPRRSDPGALPDQLAMTAEERMQSAAALHNTIVELREGVQ